MTVMVPIFVITIIIRYSFNLYVLCNESTMCFYMYPIANH